MKRFIDSPAESGPFSGKKIGDVLTRRDGTKVTFDGYDNSFRFNTIGGPTPYAVVHPGDSGPAQLHHAENGRRSANSEDADHDFDIISDPEPARARPSEAEDFRPRTTA